MRNNQQLRSTQENGLNPHEWVRKAAHTDTATGIRDMTNKQAQAALARMARTHGDTVVLTATDREALLHFAGLPRPCPHCGDSDPDRSTINNACTPCFLGTKR